MELLLSAKYRTLVVRIYGELDHHVSDEVRVRVDREMGRTGAVNVAFDFSNVSFMDSSGIGVIMGRYKLAGALGGKVIIYGASDSVKRIISMSGIEGIIISGDSFEECVREAALDV